MASYLSAKKKREQKRQKKKPPEDFVDYLDEHDDSFTDPSRQPRRQRHQQQYPGEDDRARIHGQSPSTRPRDYHSDDPLYEEEPPRYEREPGYHEREPRFHEREPGHSKRGEHWYIERDARYDDRRFKRQHSDYDNEPGRLEGRPGPGPGPLRGSEDAASVTTEQEAEMVELRRSRSHPPRRYTRNPQYVQSPSLESGESSAAPRPIRASAYSTLSVKSWSELNHEIGAVMRDLNSHFKPIFDKHGPEGVRIKKLREELNNRSSQHLLTRSSIAERLMMADRDGDDYLSYGDFVIMITQDLKQERKMAFRGMLLSTIGSIGVLPIEMRDSFLANYTLCPPPLFIPLVTLLEVIIFAVYVADMEKRGMAVTANSGYPYYSPLPYSPSKRQEAWRFLTYMLIHDGYLHILFNVIAQLVFGFPLEIVHKWWRVAIIYLVGVIAGSLAHSVVDPVVGLVGASGGVYAILGAHLAAVVTNWREMNYKLCDQEEFDSRPCCAISRFFFSAPARMVLILVIVVPDTALAIVRRVALDEDLKVGVSAHVGGFLSGLFLGIPVLKNVNKHAWETHLGWITLVVFLSVCAFAVFFNSFYHERYPPTDWS